MTDRKSEPKAWRIMLRLLQAVVFTVIEVMAALSLDGLLSLGLWLIAGWNVVFSIALIYGTATLAAERLKS